MYDSINISTTHFSISHYQCNKKKYNTEFKEERKVLLEVIGPELQSIYDDRQIEVGSFSLALFFFTLG